MASIDYNPIPKLTLNAGGSYSLAKSKMHDVNFASDEHTDGYRLDNGGLWKGTYDVANANGMEAFSELDYKVIDVNIGATYNISEKVGLSVNYNYSDVDSGEEYVYGDESGANQAVMGFVTYRF